MSSDRIPRWRLTAADVTAGFLLLVFGVMKTYALAPALSDENIYFYMCMRIAEGALPYRDFFFAHPPFHLVPGAVVMALAGFSLPAAKAIPALATAAAGVAVYRAARRCGPLASLLALVLFLFSYDLLRASSHYTGASEATALLAWALERALANRPRAAGLLAASAALTAFYAIPAGVALLVWIALRRETEPLRAGIGKGKPRGGVGRMGLAPAFAYALAYGALFAGVNLICLAVFRADYWDPVFRYHLMKPPSGEGNLASILRGLTRENPWLLWSGPAALVSLTFAWRSEGWRSRGVDHAAGSTGSQEVRRRAGRLEGGRVPTAGRLPSDPVRASVFAGLLTATLHLGFFSLLARIYTFYALPAFPALALAGGIAYSSALVALGRGTSPWLVPLGSAASRILPRRLHGGLRDPGLNDRLVNGPSRFLRQHAGSSGQESASGSHGENGEVFSGQRSASKSSDRASGRGNPTIGSGVTGRAGAARGTSRRNRPRTMAEAGMRSAILIVPLFLPALFPLGGIDAEEGEVLRRYTWRDAPLPGWTNALVRGLLWSDERVAGAWSPALTRYLWHESRHFTAPAALAEKLKELTPREGTVFGDSIAAPLVALLSGRRIALDHADTNSMRYRSGITPPAEAIAELETAPPAAIVANARRGFFLVPEVRAWVTSRYEVAFSFDDPIYGRYDLYVKNP